MEGKIIIGDIHGSNFQLKALLRLLDRHDRQFIFLGDYVNRGEDSKGVLDTLIEFQCRGKPTTFLCGNHDFAWLKYIERNVFEPIASMGGMTTLASYLGSGFRGDFHSAIIKAFPESHRAFLKKLQPHYEDEYVFCSHTGWSQPPNAACTIHPTVLETHLEMFQPDFDPPKLTVCGHYVQKDGIPFETAKFVCLDTGCGTEPNGWLTALLLPEMYFVQVNRKGEVRSWPESLNLSELAG